MRCIGRLPARAPREPLRVLGFVRCIGRSPARAGARAYRGGGSACLPWWWGRVLAGIFLFRVRLVCGAPRGLLLVLVFVRCIGRSPARAGRVPTVAGVRVLAGIFSFRVRLVCGAPRGPLLVLGFVRCIGRSPARVSGILFDALPSAHYNSGMKKVLDMQNAASTISTKNKEQRTKNKEQRTKNKEQRTKNKEQRTKNKGEHSLFFNQLNLSILT